MADTNNKHNEWLNESSHDLEDHIEMLRELDDLRIKSAQMRNEGCAVFGGEFDDFDKVDVIGKAGLVRVLCLQSLQPFKNIKELKGPKSKLEKLKNDCIKVLENLTINEIYDDKISVLTAAHVLQALAESPRSALSKSAILCYYWIIPCLSG